jgi:hypothetical protein
MLSVQGVPLTLVSRLQLDAARAARELGEKLWAHLSEHVPDQRSHDDLAKVAVQLSATAFEIAFLAAASRDEQEPGTVQPT